MYKVKQLEKLKKTPKKYLILGIVLVFIALVGLNDLRISKPSVDNTVSTSNNSSQGNTIEKEEGDVIVTVSYLPDTSTGDKISFNIDLNTHSVPLDSFDFTKNIILEKDGSKIVPLNVIPSGSEHHRSAEITFTKTPPPFTIVVTYLAGISRREFPINILN